MHILAIVVVYECDLEKIKSLSVLNELLCTSRDCAVSGSESSRENTFVLERVVIYDNSLVSKFVPHQGSAFTYIHDPSNGGTAAAYTRAGNIAQEAGIDWILLLDQDSLLPIGFLEAAISALRRCEQRPAALVPWVFHGHKAVSPARLTIFGGVAPFPYAKEKLVYQNLSAISSGSIVNTAALNTILPIPRDFWLDFVDHWIYRQFWLRRSHVIVFDAMLQHELSVLKCELLSPSRIDSILDGEFAFLLTLGLAARLAYPFRLAARLIRYSMMRPDLALHIIKWVARGMRRPL